MSIRRSATSFVDLHFRAGVCPPRVARFQSATLPLPAFRHLRAPPGWDKMCRILKTLSANVLLSSAGLRFFNHLSADAEATCGTVWLETLRGQMPLSKIDACASRRIHWQNTGSSSTTSERGRPRCLPPDGRSPLLPTLTDLPMNGS